DQRRIREDREDRDGYQRREQDVDDELAAGDGLRLRLRFAGLGHGGFSSRDSLAQLSAVRVLAALPQRTLAAQLPRRRMEQDPDEDQLSERQRDRPAEPDGKDLREDDQPLRHRDPADGERERQLPAAQEGRGEERQRGDA